MTVKGDNVCWGGRCWQLGGYICSCIHSNWSLATFHVSNGKQQKWVNCEVHGKSLTNNRIPHTTPRKLPPRKLAPSTLPITQHFHSMCVTFFAEPVHLLTYLKLDELHQKFITGFQLTEAISSVITSVISFSHVVMLVPSLFAPGPIRSPGTNVLATFRSL